MLHLNADNFVAHRGLQYKYPENSLIGIIAAIEAGACNVEVDVQFSRDGVPMLYHDHSLQRISGVDASVVDYDAVDLQTMPAFEPARWPQKFTQVKIEPLNSLLVLMEKYPRVHFFIEVKKEALADHGLDYVASTLANLFASSMMQISLISFDALLVKQAKLQYGFKSTGIVLATWASRNALIKEAAADIAYINLKKIPEAAVINADCPIAVYEVADSSLALETLQRGAAKIESFSIDHLLQKLCLS